MDQEKNDMNETPVHFSTQNRPDIGVMGMHIELGYVQNAFPVHTHAFYETFIVVSGEADHILNGQIQPLRGGDVFSIRGDAAHGFANARNLKIINLMYAADFFRLTHSEIRAIPGFDACFLVEPEIACHLDTLPIFRLDSNSLQYVATMAEWIQAQSVSQKSCTALQMQFAALFAFLATCYEEQGAGLPGTAALSRALAFMETHLAENIPVARIAAAAFLSARQLERIFRASFGKSPMQYLLRMRLEKARSLLRARIGVAETARLCGFEDPSYFARLFRQAYGHPPSLEKEQT